jgi:hypothetical protein
VNALVPSPLDSISTVRYKIFKQSVALLTTLLVGIFTLSYNFFPGSFLQYNPAEQWSNYLAGSSLDPSAMEYPEYSESGAVLFFPGMYSYMPLENAISPTYFLSCCFAIVYFIGVNTATFSFLLSHFDSISILRRSRF